jgi:hypothetical protein
MTTPSRSDGMHVAHTATGWVVFDNSLSHPLASRAPIRRAPRRPPASGRSRVRCATSVPTKHRTSEEGKGDRLL